MYNHAVCVAFECILPTDDIRREDLPKVFARARERLKQLEANPDESLEAFEIFDTFEED